MGPGKANLEKHEADGPLPELEAEGGMTADGPRGVWGDGNILKLDLGDGCTVLSTFQNINYTSAKMFKKKNTA